MVSIASAPTSRRGSQRIDNPTAGPGEPPRLLILTPDFPPTHGGIQTLVGGLARGIKGFNTEVLTLDAPGARGIDGACHPRTRRVNGHSDRQATRILALNVAAVRHATRFRPAATLSAHVVTSPAAALIRRIQGGPTAQYFHANEILDKPRLSAFAAERADVAIAVSSYTASLIAATGASPRDLRLIPPGIDLPARGPVVEAERPTIVTIAQLKHRYKGHDVMIRALAGVRAQVPGVEWVVIGEGPLRPELEALASSSGLAGVARFLGLVSDVQRDRWLRRADVFAMPSRLAGEGFGIVYLEAGAHGKPVVAGNVGGPLDAVAHGVSGLLVDPTDAVAVGEAIVRLLLDRELAKRLGEGGAERARRHAWPAIAGEVERALLENIEALR